ncbi:MAG TPA: hypothetical protein VGB61_07900, partial [Pyrinomonadaceae bacterium]
GLSDDASRTAVHQLTDDIAANALLAIVVAVPLVVVSAYQRLKLKLRARVALESNSNATTIADVKAHINEQTATARVAAVMTLDPNKLEESIRL